MTDNEQSVPADNASSTAPLEQQSGDPAPVKGTNGDQQTAPLVPLPSTGAGQEEASPLTDEIWAGLKRLPNYAKLTAALARDPRVPKQAKAMLAVGGGYMISPFDLIPGIIPVAGQIDDLYVMLTALKQAIKVTPDDVAEEHLREAGVTRANLDADLAAIRRLVKVAAVKTARFGWRVAQQTSQQLLQFANQARDRARKGPDHEPL
jgi:uncharacterized membrane protein YkvA (DUF1232 family)